MAIIGHTKLAGFLNILLNAINFVFALILTEIFLHNGTLCSPHQLFRIDALNILFIVLTTFTTTTVAVFSHSYMWYNIKTERINPQKLKLYHVMYQVFTLMLLLTFSTNNIGFLWVNMEGATLATVLLVSLYRSKEAIEAAWKYFILCIVGIALALFGTILFYASANHIPNPNNAILWDMLYLFSHQLNPSIVKLAFIFILVGFGTKIGLVPLHHWLPDAYSESPAPISALLSGLLSNAALYALIRFKTIVDATLGNHLAGNLLISFGLLSFLYAAIMLHRQNDIKRLFSYSSIENMGLITFAFGLSNPLATFSAIFYMLAHSLTKSAIFITIGNIIRFQGTKNIGKLRGLINLQPYIGWGLLIATLAIASLPPFSIFISEVTIFLVTAQYFPWLVIVLILGLLIVFSGLFRNIQPMVYDSQNSEIQDGGLTLAKQPIPSHSKYKYLMSPAFIHLSIVLLIGLYLPNCLTKILEQATFILT